MNRMKLLLKRIIPCLLIVLCVFTLASCKPKKLDKGYPDVTPAISNPNEAFLTLGNYKVSNQSVYNHLLNSYGLDELYDWIDSIVLKEANEYDTHYNDAEFNLNLEQIIYGVDEKDNKKSNKDNLTAEEQKETLENFEKDMRGLGYFTKEAYTEYYKLEYRRMSFAVNAFKQFVKEYNEDKANKEDYFTEETIQKQFDNLHRPSYNIILVTFDSEKEAKDTMAKVGIDLTNLNANWKINGAEATAESLKNVFKEMAKSTGEDQEEKTLTYTELQNISSSIASKVDSLESVGTDVNQLTKSYTHGPTVYGSRYYLVLKVGDSFSTTTKPTLSDADKEEIVHTLVENAISTDYVDKVLNEERNKLNLKIYDQGLETKYVAAYKTSYKNLSITEYDAFKTTTDESDSIVAEFTFDGKTYKLTAQQMFEKLTKKYSAIISLLLIQQYVVLTEYNKVYDIVNGKVLDQEKYDEYYKTDVQKYKTAFEEGKYEENGYPTTYGWNNFLRDYLGITNEVELMYNLDSSLYSAATDALGRAIWTDKVTETNEDGELVEIESDAKVQAEMKKMLEEYFNANIIGVMAYYDKNNDGKADPYLVDTDTDSLSEELINLIYAIAETEMKNSTATGKTLEKALSQVVISYKLATSNHEVWGTYKKAGLRVSAISSTSYTNTSSINEKLKSEIKQLWDKVSNYDTLTDEEGQVIGQKLTGNALDPGYRYVKNSKAYYVTALDFTSDVFFFSQTDNDEEISTAYRISISKASAPSYTNTNNKELQITLSEYDTYLSTGSSTKSAAINAFYKGAINNLLKINNVSNAVTMNKVLEECLNQLNNVSSLNNETIEQIKSLIADSTVVPNNK